MTPPTTTRPEPIRHRLAREFVESAKDAGDPVMVALARRVWWAISFPRTQPCSAEDIARALKKKLGLVVTSEKVQTRGRVYRLSPA